MLMKASATVGPTVELTQTWAAGAFAAPARAFAQASTPATRVVLATATRAYVSNQSGSSVTVINTGLRISREQSVFREDTRRDHDFVGHVSPRSGDARARLHRAGIGVQVLLENLARAYSPQEAERGLLDSPEAAIDSTVSLGFAKTATGKPSTPNPPTPKNTAILKAKAMLIPGLVPGRVVRLESDLYNGNYEITEVEYVGQSFGKDWMAVMVLRNYIT